MPRKHSVWAECPLLRYEDMVSSPITHGSIFQCYKLQFFKDIYYCTELIIKTLLLQLTRTRSYKNIFRVDLRYAGILVL